MNSLFWDERYKRDEYVYGKEPNCFFKKQLKEYSIDSLLLPAEGEGRNAVYAASLGIETVCVDFSQQAKNKALALAKSHKLTLEYTLADVMAYSDRRCFDAVAFIFAHNPLRAKFHVYYKQFVKPKGYVFLQGFSKEQFKKKSGGPQNPDMLFSVEELREDFSGFEIIKMEKGEAVLNEGSFHAGLASVVSMVAQKL